MGLYIKSIDLKNFKSFRNETHIPFFDEFMVISGPNGSGKSNVLDAILFTLGLSNSRDMRAERLTDLIYSSGNGDGIDQAEVKVHFDNSDRVIPIDRDAVTVSRRIKKTDKGYYSYYYINGRACNFSEVQDMLLRSSLTQNSYNVIMQGDVTRILNMSAFERRKIIDEISGVAEFDEKKEQAHQELDEVRIKIERLDVILEELKNRLKILKTERDQAIEYENLRNEQQRYEGKMLLADLKLKERELDEIQTSITESWEKKTVVNSAISKKTAQIDDLQSELDDKEIRLVKQLEEDDKTLKKEIEEVNGSINRCNDRIKLDGERIEDLKVQMNKIFIEIDSAKSELETIHKRFDEERIRKGRLKEALDEKVENLDQIKKEIEAAGLSAQNATEKLYALREELDREKKRQNEILVEQNRILDRSRMRSGRIDALNRRITELEAELGTKQKELAIEEERIGEVTRDLKENEKELDIERIHLKNLEDDLRHSERKIMEIEARLRAEKEFRGYSEGVKAVMEAARSHQLEGIYGTIAELGRVDDHFAPALEAAAGNRMQFIIVETDMDGQYAIEYLKQTRKGRATFLPLNRLKKGKTMPKPDAEGVVDFAINLIEYDPKFGPAFYHVFQDTVVVETIEDGRRLMGRFRSVTLDGDLIERSGAMTGGTPAKSRFRFISNSENELLRLQEEHSILETQRREQLEKIKLLDERNKLIRDEIFGRGERRHKLQLELDEIGRMLNEAGNELDGLKEGVDQARIIELETALAESSEVIATLEAEITELEHNLKSSKIPELSKKEREVSEEIRRIEGRIADIDLSIKSIVLEEENLEKRISDGNNRLKELDNAITAIKNDIDLNKARINELEQKREAMRGREKELEEELLKLKTLFKERFDQIMALKEEIEGLKLRRERIEAALTDLSRIKDGLVSQINALQTRIEAAGMNPEEAIVEDREEIEQRINEIGRRMRSLEPVNMKAIDEFREVESRLNEMQKRRNTLINEREGIIERIEGYAVKKREVFLATFDAINENFKEVFRELSDGSGKLILESRDDPFQGGLLIEVQPSGKPVQRLDALSGGEKSLTALSLLFAIQRYRPAPFYALDEIDMMLDGVNVEKVARLIEKLSHKTQFIVVSLREPMIERASKTIGVVMQDGNVSTVTGIQLRNRDLQEATST
ncbi:chromosome segregation protein SMC [Methanosarcinales archaeon]|nr:MAG: chromosome segregation protein SMC [Methanosarcinales archaeon]